MKRIYRTTLAVWVILLFAGVLFGQVPARSPSAEWRSTLRQHLSVYGHRNWIVVADSAFPAYSENGIETIVADEDMPSVLKYVMAAIRSSKHVRATAFLDEELQFVGDDDYPGATHLKKEINGILTGIDTTSIPHSEVLSKIEDAGKTYRILFIKTNATIPYTSVYMRLDCGYMSDEVDRKIKDAVSGVK
jgi:D-ribose pyranose/furanose isomerase RbsD